MGFQNGNGIFSATISRMSLSVSPLNSETAFDQSSFSCSLSRKNGITQVASIHSAY